MSDTAIYVEFDTRRSNAPARNRRTVMTFRRGYRGQPFSYEFREELSVAEQKRTTALVLWLLALTLEAAHAE